jgi:hypothetical protein
MVASSTAGPTIVNLTPHRVTVRNGLREWTFDSAGVARVRDTAQPAGSIAGVPVTAVSTGDVADLPDPTPDTVFLVSRVLALALPDRRDLVFPFGEIRDDAGRIVAVESLARFVEQPTAPDNVTAAVEAVGAERG